MNKRILNKIQNKKNSRRRREKSNRTNVINFPERNKMETKPKNKSSFEEPTVKDGPPEWVYNSFNNVEDILHVITDEGLKKLDYKVSNYNMKNKTDITQMGVVITLRNRNNNPFKVVVCPDYLSEDDNFRNVLYKMGKGVEENFPHRINQ